VRDLASNRGSFAANHRSTPRLVSPYYDGPNRHRDRPWHFSVPANAFDRLIILRIPQECIETYVLVRTTEQRLVFLRYGEYSMHIVGPNIEPNLAFVCRTDGNVTCEHKFDHHMWELLHCCGLMCGRSLHNATSLESNGSRQWLSSKALN
jgi:hypothetical protein